MAKPIVDGIEQALNGKARVYRLDLLSGVGREAAARFGVHVVPALAVVDGSGQLVLKQVGLPSSAEVQAKVQELLGKSAE